MARWLVLTLVGGSLVLALAGCPDPGPHPGPDPINFLHELEDWARSLLGDHDPASLEPPPVPPSQLRLLAVGASAVGDRVSAGSRKITEYTDLSPEEQRDLSCDLARNVVSGELSPDPRSVEKFVVGQVEGRVIQDIPQLVWEHEIAEVSGALKEAKSSDQEFADVAMAAACWSLKLE
jgi:hypothetical protein